MRRRLILAGTALACACAVPALAQRDDAIRIYVYAVGEREGFADPASQPKLDAAKDVADQLRKKKRGIVIVASPDRADVTVEILGRGLRPTGRVTSQGIAYGGVATASAQAEEIRFIAATLRAGDYTLPIEVNPHNTMPTWRALAGRMADEITTWVHANRDRLLARRQSITAEK